ncbi:MAG: hypothetical protein IE926_09820 [Micrococcales bacterium]|nr:hypothetical protein [Micrococcales bacterium]
MSRRADWSRARRAALDGQSGWRAQRHAADDRCSDLGVQVVTALRERDAWVRECEQRAAAAIERMVRDEGVPVREVVRWCAGELTVPEVTRLRRMVGRPADTADTTTSAEPPARPDPQ